MEQIELLLNIFKDHGVWGLLLVVLVYVVLKSKFTFTYPRASTDLKDKSG